MNRYLSAFLQRSMNRLNHAFPFVSRGLGISIGLWVTWMFCFNGNSDALKALDIAKFFIWNAQIKIVEQKNEEANLIKPKNKLR